MVLWTSVILHVAALALNVTANIAFFITVNAMAYTASFTLAIVLTSVGACSLRAAMRRRTCCGRGR